MNEAREIAEKLTPAQREELTYVCKRFQEKKRAPAWSSASRVGGYYNFVTPIRPVVAAALYRRGLLVREEYMETERSRGTSWSDRWRFRWVYKPSAIGLQVRAILNPETSHHG